MTKQQAEEVAAILQERLHPSKLWSITVDETRKIAPDAQTKYRVLIHMAGGREPLAIYSARMLRSPIVAREAIL
jgi:hypothetical protein